MTTQEVNADGSGVARHELEGVTLKVGGREQNEDIPTMLDASLK